MNTNKLRTYQLVNPVIEGTYNSIVEHSESPIHGADVLWNRLTEHVSGHVPKFWFTTRDVETHDIYNFEAKEKMSDRSYKIKELENINLSNETIDGFHNQIDSVTAPQTQSGGRKRYKDRKKHNKTRYYEDEDSSTSSNSSTSSSSFGGDVFSGVEFVTECVTPYTTPIAMFHYTTKFYQQSNGTVIKHESTMNPVPVIIKPVPVVQTYAPVVMAEHTFTSIPVFKRPLLPMITIWN